ncbi:hypothetical protein [Methylosinus sp. Sm6]|uniref:hypothetical protein n=1 Tax=Methylosinus sp. Sm6 TaxID=2866948 RepID=UPI001C9997ED|nr:hypothetical protein [Methylosinus sp. Sm6]MBY6243148.1 hypothetical protein [Methylosinus sp. Sm6]
MSDDSDNAKSSVGPNNDGLSFGETSPRTEKPTRRAILTSSVAAMAAFPLVTNSEKALAGGSAPSPDQSHPMIVSISSKQHEELLLHFRDLGRRMSTNDSLRIAFLSNPVGVLMTAVAPGATTPFRSLAISESNRLTFTLLSNPKFVNWIRAYSKKIDEQIKSGALSLNRIDRAAITSDLARGMMSNLTKEEAAALFYAENVRGALPDGAARVQPAGIVLPVFAIAAVLAYSIIAIFSISWLYAHSYIGGYSAGAPGVSGANFRGIADQIIHHAREYAASGKLFDPHATFSDQ